VNVFINAMSIRDGGGLVVLKKLLEEMINISSNIKWYVASNPDTVSQISAFSNVEGIPYVWPDKSPLHHFIWYETEIPRLLKKVNADVCFSQTNFLPRLRLPCPSLLLVHNAGFFSKKFTQLYKQWNKKYITRLIWKQKINWVYKSIRKATAVTVQTNALANRIIQQVNIQKEKLFVVPHGLGLLKEPVKTTREFQANRIWRIGYITKFGVQKDFITAFNATKVLSNLGISVKLILTLDHSSREFKGILQQIHQADVKNYIENHGEISDPIKLKNIYDSLDIFVFPSLCESFGFTLVEAMASGLPVVMADTESNREVTNNVGEKFSPENQYELADKIQQLINDKDRYNIAAKQSLERSNIFSWNKAAGDILGIMQQITLGKIK
jgi:glycosyltransferase involved in cell wall biosynthesis